MKPIKPLLVFVLLASACSTAKTDFDRGSISEDQFDRESAGCEMEGEKNRSMQGQGGIAGISNHYATYNSVFDACMRSKGYKRK